MKEWVIYTKKDCVYCEAAKTLLKQNGLSFIDINVNDLNKSDIYKLIDASTNSYRYFPIIFKDNRFIGGYNELNEFFEENDINELMKSLRITNKRKRSKQKPKKRRSSNSRRKKRIT
jgi:glutaredoxin 3